jgi:hypothetical protein
LKDVSIVGWTKRERARRKEDENPTLTTFRLDLIHVAQVLHGAVLSPRIQAATSGRFFLMARREDG